LSDDEEEEEEEEVVVPKKTSSTKTKPVLSDDEEEEEEEVVVPKKASGKKTKPVLSDDEEEEEEEVVPVVKKPTKKASKGVKNEAKKAKAAMSDDDSESGSSETQKRKVKTPVERLDLIMKKLDESGVTKEVVSQLLRLRKQLDGAKIKQTKGTRAPNAYNLWMREKMAELKDNGMAPKDRFAECIRIWNEQKKAKL
jgi:chemotaxis protein histidine kinase CheA